MELSSQQLKHSYNG